MEEANAAAAPASSAGGSVAGWLGFLPAVAFALPFCGAPALLAASVWVNHDVMGRRPDLADAAFAAVQGFSAAVFACAMVYCLLAGLVGWVVRELGEPARSRGPFAGAFAQAAALFPSLAAGVAGAWGLLVSMHWPALAGVGIACGLALLFPLKPLPLWFRWTMAGALLSAGGAALSLIPIFR